MVNPVIPKITILENPEYQLLILGTTLLIFMLIILYFSRLYYKKSHTVAQEYNVQTNQTNSYVAPAGLKSCNRGECIVNTQTGLKKCPSNDQTILYYDPGTEACSTKTTCPSQIPYAVHSDGSVDRYGNCESGVACRCSNKITCPRYNASKFSITNGSIFSTYGSQQNYIFDQIPYTAASGYNGALDIDPTKEYCKLNSTYTGSLVGGCSFLNQINDFLIDCSKENLSDEISASPYSLDPFYLTTKGKDEFKQYCELQPYLDSNWNNMSICMSKNPCKSGNMTYNFDEYRGKNNKTTLVNSRNFCFSGASDLKTYMSDLQFYTLSCIKGVKCNTLPTIEESQKFFSGTNQDFDIAAINASYQMTYDGTSFSFLDSPDLKPHLYMKNGDLLSFGDQYYVVRVDGNVIKIYIYPDTNETTPQNGTYTYYPQFGLNGFGYNVVTKKNYNSYDIPNTTVAIVKSSKISNADTFYTPVADITNNKTFYRSGLSKPKGYVLRSEINATPVTSGSFNADDYEIKKTKFDTAYYNDISLYNSVWNNRYGQTECIRCNPLLTASINMAQTGSGVNTYIYDQVTIQFSGQDFGHYRKNFEQLGNPDKVWCYESRATVNKSLISTPKNVYLQQPNSNIKDGDYVLSSEGELEFKIKPIGPLDQSMYGKTYTVFIGDAIVGTNNQTTNITPFHDDGTNYAGIGVDNNTYQDFKTESHCTCHIENGDQYFTITDKTKAENFLFGNVYNAVFLDSNDVTEVTTLNTIFNLNLNLSYNNNLIIIPVTIVPVVQVKLTDKSNIIQLTNTKLSTLTKSSTLQFISYNRNLILENDKKVINSNLPGSGGQIQIDEITDGRITSIKVVQSGTGYTNASPLVRLKSYDPYFLE